MTDIRPLNENQAALLRTLQVSTRDKQKVHVVDLDGRTLRSMVNAGCVKRNANGTVRLMAQGAKRLAAHEAAQSQTVDKTA